MGLDMYLYRREYVSGYSWKNDVDEKYTFDSIVNAVGITPTQESPHIHVEVCVAYWRKANAVHKWFCDLDGGRDECQSIYVPREKLVELRDLCKSIIEQPAMASSVLPTQPGFFFGSYDYDEWYMEDMKNTVSQLDAILADTSEDGFTDFIYRASW